MNEVSWKIREDVKNGRDYNSGFNVLFVKR